MLHKTFKSEVPYAILNSIDLKKMNSGYPKDFDKYKKK